MSKPKFKNGDKVIMTASIIPHEVRIAVVLPKRWWHRQYRYLTYAGLPGNYDRYKEGQLIAAPQHNRKDSSSE